MAWARPTTLVVRQAGSMLTGRKGLPKRSRIKAQRELRAPVSTAACSAAARGSSQPHQTASRLATHWVEAALRKFSATEGTAPQAESVAHATAAPAAKLVA